MGKILYPDYFPVCIPTGTLSYDTSRYLKFNLQEAMAFFWRVRSWKIQMVGGYSYDLGEDFGRIQIQFLGETRQINSLVETEEQLVCFRGIFNNPIYDLSATVTVSGGTNTISAGNDFDYYFSNNTYLEQLDAFRIANTFYIPLIISSGFFSYDSYRDVSSYPPQISTGQYSISFNNIIKTGTLYVPVLPETAYSGFYKLSISANSYWSYGGTYDTATGEPL
jgi:hypothetical protein